MRKLATRRAESRRIAAEDDGLLSTPALSEGTAPLWLALIVRVLDLAIVTVDGLTRPRPDEEVAAWSAAEDEAPMGADDREDEAPLLPKGEGAPGGLYGSSHAGFFAKASATEQ